MDKTAPVGDGVLVAMNRRYRAITGREEGYFGWDRQHDGRTAYVFTDGTIKLGYQAAIAHMSKMIEEARVPQVLLPSITI